MLLKCCGKYVSKFEKLSSGHRTGRGQFSFQSLRKAMSKNAQTTTQLHSSQFSSVTQSCPTLCDPMNHSMPGLPVHHHLSEFTQTHIHRVSDAIQPSHPQSSPFPMSQLFAWVGQSTGVSVLASFLPKKSQGWSSEWTGWISLQSKGLSRVFSNTTVQKHQFFGAQPSSQSNYLPQKEFPFKLILDC